MTGCEAIVAAAWFCALAKNPDCLPVRHRWLAPALYAIAKQESGLRPHALRDEKLGQEIRVRNEAEAVAYVLAHPGRKVGAGMMQITGHDNLVAFFGKEWWKRAFKACHSLRAGALHFAERDMPRAFASYNGTGEAAAAHARRVAAHLDAAVASATSSPPAPARPRVCGALPAWGGLTTARDTSCQGTTP